MQRLLFTCSLLVFTLLWSGCTRVSLRDHVFASQPIMEAEKLQTLRVIEATQTSRSLPTVSAVNMDEAPGLALLVHQVLGRPITFSPASRGFGKTTTDSKPYKNDFNGLRITEGDNPEVLSFGVGDAIAYDDFPLSPTVASLDVTKAIVRSMEVAYLRANGKDSEKLEDMKLSRCDFEDFAKEVLKTIQALELGSSIDGIDRTKKLALAEANSKIRLDGLLLAYLTAYYKGEFVDRTGGYSQKPKIGLTITNETITGFLHVIIEALADFAILDSEKLRVPIIYEGKETTPNPTFVNASGKTPTLATYAMKLHGSNVPFIKYGIEPKKRNDQIGISSEKLDYIRLASGLAADASQSLTGALVRLLGGANLGFVVMGKLSFGDNETTVKAIDTIVEGASMRVTEAFVSHILYGVKIPVGVSVTNFLAGV